MATGNRYPVPARPATTEEVIRRSRFITTLAPAASVEIAKVAVEGVRQEHPDATHHCFAYLVGAPGSTSHVGLSDDGEPHGTAGRPMLNVILHSGVGDIVAVVTRYYGGTKLGKGGLARAYSGGVKCCLDILELREKVSWRRLELDLEYAVLASLRNLCPDFEAEIEAESFTDKVELQVRLPEERAADFNRTIGDRFGPSIRVKRG